MNSFLRLTKICQHALNSYPLMSFEPAVDLDSAPLEAPPVASGVVRAAAIVSFGNVMSRVLGLVRVSVITHLFGQSGYVSVFVVATFLVQTLYDFFVGGLVSAALVPVFSDYAERREELWRLASTVLSALALILGLAVLVLEFFAPQLIEILGPGYDPVLKDAGVQMIRLMLPALLFIGLAGILTGLLYSLKRFTYPAFTTAAFNGSIIIVALLLTPQFGINSLVAGILVGAASQVLLQWPGLRDARLHWSVDWGHPALRRIFQLYLPVVGGVAIGILGGAIDRNLASRTGAQSVAWMQTATTLQQFPLGLVATAIAVAILPSLSRAAAPSEFQSTLALGLKMVLLLILPATVSLFLLAQPVVALLFEHGAFTIGDTLNTARALQLYLLGVPFAAIDQPLVFAFYARKNTLTPNLVAIVGVAIYLVVALVLIQPFGMLGLVLANAAQLTAHALVMLYLLKTRLGGIYGQGLVSTTIRVVGASLAMGVVIVLVASFGIVGDGIVAKLLRVLIPGASALLVYFLGLRLLHVREAEHLLDLVRRQKKS